MSLLADLLDLVLPRLCIGCGAPAGLLCRRCAPAGPPNVVGGGGVGGGVVAGGVVGGGVVAGGVVAGGVVPTVAAARYADAVRAAVLAYKERGRRDLATPLGDLLARAVGGVQADRGPPRRAVLVPVPSSPAAVAARGGDHVLRLARRAAARCGVRPAPRVLVLTRTPHDSAGLGVDDRSRNLDHAMRAAARPVPGWAAIVVDDVVTTGATLREAVRALSAAGWPVAGAAVVAATPRRSGPGAAGPLAAPSQRV